MNKYKTIWYEGCLGISGHDGMCAILKEKTVEADEIFDVKWDDFLPDTEEQEPYFRMMLTEDGDLDIDYGSWSRFVRIEKVVE